MPTPAAERMRRMRARRNTVLTGPILYEREDWRLFVDPHTLPQKAGCEPDQIGRIIAKELTDNALDNWASGVVLTGDQMTCTVADNGPGLSEADMLRVFAVNRPLVSSKLVRLPTRGKLGNGLRVIMGAVAAFGGTISVTTRGRIYHLGTETVTGVTWVIRERLARPRHGIAVTIEFPRPMFRPEDFYYARTTIALAKLGRQYDGPSRPSWYSPKDLCELLARAKDTPPAAVIEDAFGIAGSDATPTLDWAAGFIEQHPAPAQEDVGELGEDAFPGSYYRKVTGRAAINGAMIPFTVEAWVEAEAAEKDTNTRYHFHPLLNCSFTLATLNYNAGSDGLWLHGCGLEDINAASAKRAKYNIDLSLIAPYVPLMNDGKTPYLGNFRAAIQKAVTGAAIEAYHNLVRPKRAMTIAEAAYEVMKEAYLHASGGGKLPAPARTIMYSARPKILAKTGAKTFNDKYFTGTLLPRYMQDHPEETADWDVVYDARGELIEPHTGRQVALGTVAVREYLGLRPASAARPRLDTDELMPTIGPANRYRTVLFVEKQGLDEVIAAARLAERWDLASMSTKGTSVIAARHLLDELMARGLIDLLLIAHDCDVSGFTIAGTLVKDSDRFTFSAISGPRQSILGLDWPMPS
jgi:hypothetical protein